MPRARPTPTPPERTVEEILLETRDDVTLLRDAFDWHALQRSDGRISPHASAAVSRICDRAAASLTSVVQALPAESLNQTAVAGPSHLFDG